MSLNAPFGARCFLTFYQSPGKIAEALDSLNAPFGARCFLTPTWGITAVVLRQLISLNAPFGARCFLTSRPTA